MTKTEDLMKQLKDKPFRDMKFTVYNYIEEQGYLKELQSKYGKLDIDDFEMIIFDIDENTKKNIKNGKKTGYVEVINFKYDIEYIRQKGIPELSIFVMREYPAVVAVKLKEINIYNIIN